MNPEQPPKSFEVRIDNIPDIISKNIFKEIRSTPKFKEFEEKEILHSIKKWPEFEKIRGRHFQSLIDDYTAIYSNKEMLSDAEKRAHRANTWDHTKALIFRFLNAIMIAAVILLAGWIAKTLEIPIPLLPV